MFDRLSDKSITPSIEYLVAYVSSCKELFDNIDSFLINDLNAEKIIRYSSDKNVRAWGIKYHRKSKYLCDIIVGKNSFTVMMRLSDDQIKKSYNIVLPYSKECLDNYQRTSNGGWVQHRVSNLEHLTEVKKILEIRSRG